MSVFEWLQIQFVVEELSVWFDKKFQRVQNIVKLPTYRKAFELCKAFIQKKLWTLKNF